MKKSENPIYKDNKNKYEYAWDHYTAKYAELEADGGSIRHYLEQKYQREDNKSYDERLKVTDPVVHFSTVVDGINGVIASKENDTVRSFGALGDIEEEGIAKWIYHNADLQGTNWEPLMKKAGIMLTVLHDVWGLVEGVTENDEAHVQVINPIHVIDWYPTIGNLQEVLVREKRDNRSAIGQESGAEETYTLFTLDGFQRYREKDGVMEVIESGEYAYYATSRRQKRILPIFKTSIPFPRHLGYQLALKENHIFNKKSVRDFALRNLSFAILNLKVESAEEFDSIKNALVKGSNMIPSYADQSHSFISPDGSYISDFGNVIEKDVEDFYLNAFKRYAENAKQVTATQAKLESHSGIEAFLGLLVGSVDEFENQVLKRLEQVYFPDSPGRWGEAMVKRSRDFTPKDEQEMINSMMNRAFGERDTAPFPVDALTQIIAKYAETMGIEIQDNEEITRAIEQRMDIIPSDQAGG